MTQRKVSRRRIIQGAAALSAAAASGRVGPARADSRSLGTGGRAPNIVFILADDLGWADLSSYGRRDYETEAIDKLARRGVRLTQAYANSSVCTPTRVAFFTGRYQQRLPVGLQEPLGWIGSSPPGLPGIPPEHPTIASLLRGAGYHTALIGKWHAGYLPTYSPNKSGFDDFFGIFSGGVDYFTHRDGDGLPDLWEDETPVEKTGYITDLITERAVDYVRRHAGPRRPPFYLSVHYTAPHWPWEGPGDEEVSRNLSNLFHLDGGSPKIYGEIVKRLDLGVSQILGAIDDAGAGHDTIVVFTSDNGGERFSDVWPFSGSKGGVYEGSNRVPAIVRWPDRLPENRVSQQVATTFDWTATLLAAGGVEANSSYPLDGIDLLPHLRQAGGNRPTLPRQLFWRIAGQRAVRDGDLKYIKLARPDQVVTLGGLPAALLGTEFLFDLGRDVRERANLLARRPADADRLRRAWDAWNATVLPEPARS